MCKTKGFLITPKQFIYWQKLPPIRNIVFEGGGAKALLYPGAIAAFEENDLLNEISRVAGSSAGAFTATLLAFGLNSSEMKDIINETNLISLLDPFKSTSIQSSHAIRMCWGLINLASNFLFKNKSKYAFYGNQLLEKLREIIANIVKSQAEKYPEIYEIISKERLEDPQTANITFSDLNELRQIIPKACELIITGTNITEKKLEYYGFRFTPDMEIALANRISMSLPLMFAPIEHNNKVLIDGGVLCNFPLEMFSHPPIANADDALTVFLEQNLSAIGFSVSQENLIRLPYYYGENTSFIDKFLDRHILASVGYVGAEELARIMKYNSGHFIVTLNPIGQTTTDFNVSNARKEELFNQGYQDALTYINNFRKGSAFYFKSNNIYNFLQQLYPGPIAQLCHDLEKDEIHIEFSDEMKLDVDEKTSFKERIKLLIEKYYMAVRVCSSKLHEDPNLINPDGTSIVPISKLHTDALERVCPVGAIEKRLGKVEQPRQTLLQIKKEAFTFFNDVRHLSMLNNDEELKKFLRLKYDLKEAISDICYLIRKQHRYLRTCLPFANVTQRIKIMRSAISQLVIIRKCGYGSSPAEIINDICDCYLRFYKERLDIERIYPTYFFQRAIRRSSQQFLENIDTRIEYLRKELQEKYGITIESLNKKLINPN